MAFCRVKKIGERRYLYREERYRQAGRVKTRSTYIGPFGLGRGVWTQAEVQLEIIRSVARAERVKEMSRTRTPEERERERRCTTCSPK